MTRHTDALRGPGAGELYRSLRQAAWLSPLLESECPEHRRLGARLLIEEMLERLNLPALDVSDARRETDARRERRLEGQKRAAALYIAGFSFAQIGREIGVSESKAARWARQGRTL
jgi:hypothetical protein